MISKLPETLKTVLLYQGAANAVACDVVSCANAKKVWFLIIHTGSTDTDLVLSLKESTTVGGSLVAVTKACPIWIDTDAGTTSDVIGATTAAYTLTIDPATQNGVVAYIEWDPAKHTSGYNCITLDDSGGNASDVCTVLALIEPRYTGATLMPAIVD